MYDIVVYSNKPDELAEFGKKYPHAKLVKASKINKKVIKKFKESLTSYCFIIKPSHENFIDFVPSEWHHAYTHILGDSENLLLPDHSAFSGDIYGEVITVDAAYHASLTDVTLIHGQELESTKNLMTVNFNCEKFGMSDHSLDCVTLNSKTIWQSIAQTTADWIIFSHDGVELIKDFSIPTMMDANVVHTWNDNPDYFLVPKAIMNFENDNPLQGLRFVSYKTDVVHSRHDYEFFESRDDYEASGKRFGLVKDGFCEVVDDAVPARMFWEWPYNVMYQEMGQNNLPSGYGGLGLYDSENTQDDKVFSKHKATKALPYDIIFLSNNESFADDHYQLLIDRFPHAKRVNGVQGIAAAHKAAAEASDTPNFWVVDADAVITPNFKFDFTPAKGDTHKVYTFRSRNPVNNLIYGNGGVKLLPKEKVLAASDTNIDFTTSLGDFILVSSLSNFNYYNKSPFEAWRGAFREAAKLQSGCIGQSDPRETEMRLKAWVTKGAGKENGEQSMAGAIAGKEFALNNIDDLENINNIDWLKEQYILCYAEE